VNVFIMPAGLMGWMANKEPVEHGA